jgi:hypothetical protein
MKLIEIKVRRYHMLGKGLWKRGRVRGMRGLRRSRRRILWRFRWGILRGRNLLGRMKGRNYREER